MPPRFQSSSYRSLTAAPTRTASELPLAPSLHASAVHTCVGDAVHTTEDWLLLNQGPAGVIALGWEEQGKPGGKGRVWKVGDGGDGTMGVSSLVDGLAAVGSTSGNVSVYRLPSYDPSDTISPTPLLDFSPTTKLPTALSLHPTTTSLLLVSSPANPTATLHNLSRLDAPALHTLEGLGGAWDLAWDPEGRTVGGVGVEGKEAVVKLWDVRAKSSCVVSGPAHPSTRPTRLAFPLRSSPHTLLSTGSSRMRERQYAIHDARNLAKPVKVQTVDTGSGVLVPKADQARGLVWLAGRGDVTLRWTDLSLSQTAPGEASAILPTAIHSFALAPPTVLDVMKVEVDRLVVLSADKDVWSVACNVPRRTYLDFHGDVFPELRSPVPAQSADDWLSGKDAQPAWESQDPARRGERKRPPRDEGVPAQATTQTQAAPAAEVPASTQSSAPAAAELSAAPSQPAEDASLTSRSDAPTESATVPSATPASTQTPVPASALSVPAAATAPAPVQTTRAAAAAPAPTQTVPASATARAPVQPSVATVSPATATTTTTAPAPAPASAATPKPSPAPTRPGTYSRRFLGSSTSLIPALSLHPSLLIPTHPPTSIPIAASSHALFFPLAGPGGRLAVIPASQRGKVEGARAIETGSGLVDFEVDPWEGTRIVTAGDDGRVKVWRVPEGGALDEDMGTPERVLETPAMAGISEVVFHPTARDVLLTASHDHGSPAIRLWHLGKRTAEIEIPVPGGGIHHAAISPDGAHLAVSTKDSCLSIFSLRHPSSNPLASAPSHDSKRASRLVWLSPTRLTSIGFSAGSSRKILLFAFSPSCSLEPLPSFTLDVSPSTLFPHFDADTNILYLWGRGETALAPFEYRPQEEKTAPWLALPKAAGRESVQQGVAFARKVDLDVRKVEVGRCWRLTGKTLEEISFKIPRNRAEFFQDDVFIPTRDHGRSALGADDWFAGKDLELEVVDLRPADMTPLSQAPAPAVRKAAPQKPGPKEPTDEEKRAKALDDLFERAKLDDSEEEESENDVPAARRRAPSDDEW